MGLFDRLFKKNVASNNIENVDINVTSLNEVNEPLESIELIDGKIMDISLDGVIDTESTRAIEIYKHNLRILVDETLDKGYVDKFYLIREDDYFPKNFEWGALGEETNFQSSNSSFSYALRNELAIKNAGGYKDLMGISVPPSIEEINIQMSLIDKDTGNLYLPSIFRSTRHFTINTPLELTGEYNAVPIKRNFIIFDDIDNFLKSGYGYSVAYRDAYLDASHEPLKISDKAVILIDDEKYNKLMSNEDIRKELEGKNVIRYKGDIVLAINMLLTQLGVLPSKIASKYVLHDQRIYDILDKSIKKLARDNNLGYDIGHNEHFSCNYDRENNDNLKYINEFCTLLKEKYPDASDLINPDFFVNDNRKSNNSASMQSKCSELINKIGVSELIDTVNQFNETMKEREKENYNIYLEKQKSITPLMSSSFKQSIKLIDYYYNNRFNLDLSKEEMSEIDNFIILFLHGKDPAIQYEASFQLNNIIGKKKVITDTVELELDEIRKR